MLNKLLFYFTIVISIEENTINYLLLLHWNSHALPRYMHSLHVYHIEAQRYYVVKVSSREWSSLSVARILSPNGRLQCYVRIETLSAALRCISMVYMQCSIM